MRKIFKSTNPMEHVEADGYILEKTQGVEEMRRKLYHKAELAYKKRKNAIKKSRKQERQNRKRGRK